MNEGSGIRGFAGVVAIMATISGCLEGAAPEPARAGTHWPGAGGVEPSATVNATVTREHSATTAIGHPCPGGEDTCWVGRWGITELALPERGALGGTLTATWTPSTPAAATLELRASAGDAFLATSGRSPLVLDIPREQLANASRVRVVVGPSTPGVMLEDVVTFRLDLLYPASVEENRLE